ncbi:MAG: HAD-IA family hydrolase [Cyanobacteria bacterium P01_H01_bin.15]
MTPQMEEQVNPPQLILCDVVGTLIGIRGSVGHIYAQLAQTFGVTVEPERLNNVFYEVFQRTPGADYTCKNMETLEYDWWYDIARRTFQRVDVLEQFPDFDDFFGSLYVHFATADPWFVYPDVWAKLQTWRSQRIELGILSNFDQRLLPVLDNLGLSPFFQSVTIPILAGAEKPDPQIFEYALAQHPGIERSNTWFIGDSFSQDYEGATAIGFQAILIQREE